MVKIMLFHNVRSNYKGYSTIIQKYHRANQMPGPLRLEFQQWFDAHLCAPLGIILNELIKQHTVYLNVENSENNVLNILSRNGFLEKFSLVEKHDYNQTVIHYKEFSSSDDKFFSQYVSKELLNHRSFPNVSDALKGKILESLAELFSNAVLHSKSDTIATCGQFYPQQNEIFFTIADAGIGIHQNVVDFHRRRELQYSQHAGQSIEWAMIDGNTTKNAPGGSGLAILKEFVRMNRGFIHLVSCDGFYECSENGELSRQFTNSFPGTFATVKFKTDDTDSYYLRSEIESDPNTLF